MNVGSVEVLLQLRDLLTQQMAATVGKSTAQLAKLSNEVRKTELAIDKLAAGHDRAAASSGKFGRQITTTLVHVAAAGAAYKALGAAVQSVTDQVEFTRTLTKIANVTGVTRDEIAKFKGELAGLSQATGRGPQELAEGFYFIASNGFKGAEATKVLTEAAKLAAIGLGETNDISRALAGAINAYGKENLSAAQASDQLLAAVRAGGAEASEFAGVLGRVVGIAAELGISYAQVTASVATFTRVGVGADEAVTALRGTMAALLNPSKGAEKAIAALHDAGLSAASSMAQLRAEVKEKGLATVLIDLVQATKGNVEVLGDIIPNVRALAGVLANAGSQAEAYKQILKEVEGSHGDVDRAMEDTRASVSFMWDQLGAQMEQLKLTLGEALLPGVLEFGKALAAIDSSELRDLGTSVAVSLSSLAEILKVLVSHFDAVKAVIEGMLILKLAAWLSGVAVAMDAAAVAAGGAATAWTTAGVSISAIAGPVAVAVAALLFLSNKAKEYTRNAQRDIEDMVHATEDAGKRFRAFMDIRQGRAAGTNVAVSTDDYNAALEKRKQLLAQILGSGQAVSADLLRQKRQVDEIITAYENQKRVVDGIGDGLAAQVPTLKQRDNDAESFLQRTGEVTERLKDQLVAAKADLEVARQRQQQSKEGLAAARELSLAARTQLEIDKTIQGLESAKHHLTAQQRAAVVSLVTEWMKVKEQIKLTNEETTKGERQARLQEAGQRRMLEIAERRREHERKIQEELASQVDDFREQLAVAQLSLDTSKQVLASLLHGDREGARSLELQAQFLAEYGDANKEAADWLAHVEAEQEKVNYLISKVAEIAKPAWQVYLDAAFSVIDQIGNAFSDMLVDFATTGGDNFKSIFKSLGQQIIKIFADVLADMLKRWIATQLAMAATDYASKSGNSSVKNIGKGSSASSASSAIPAAQSSGASAGTLAGWAVAAFALYVVYKGFIEDHKRKFANVTLGDQGQIIAHSEHSRKYMKGVQDAAAALLKSLKDWMAEVDIQMTKFGEVTIEHDATSWQVISNGMRQSFATMEEALSAAQAMMVRFGEFADSVPSLVRAAVMGTRDLNIESLTSNIQFARTLLTQNMEDVARSMADATDLFIEQMHRSFELFGQAGRNFDASALAEATASSILHFTNSLTELYNQLTGHKEDPREAAERQRTAYNMQRTIMIAQITLLYEEIKARIAALQVQIATLNVLRQLGVGGGTTGGNPSGEGGGGRIGTGGENWFNRNVYNMHKGGGAFRQDDRNPTNDPQLAQLLQILDNLARALQNLPPEIGEGGVKPGRGGGGRNRGSRQQVQEFIDNQRFQLAQAGRNPLQQEIEEIRRSFAEQLEAAGKNVKLRQELLALEQQAIDAARERFQADVQQRFDEITGRTNAFTELHKKFADMRKDILAAGFAADKTTQMMDDLAKAEEDAARVLGMQMNADLLGGIAQYIDDAEVKQKFLVAQAKLEYAIKLEMWAKEIELLRLQGKLSDDLLAAWNYLLAHPPSFDIGGSGGDYQPPTGRLVWDGTHWVWVQDTGEDPMAAINRAHDLLSQYQTEGLSKWHQALKKLNDDFEMIRAALGNTPEVAQAYADALARLREQFLSGLRDFYEQITTGSLSGGSVRTQYDAARANYQRLLAIVQGGDLSQADALQKAAEQYLQLAGQMFDTSTLGYTNIRNQIRDQIAALLGINVGTGGNVIGGPEWFMQGTAQQVEALGAINTQATAQVAATANVANVVDIASRRQEMYLADMATTLVSIDNRLAALEANSATANSSTSLAVGDSTTAPPFARRRKGGDLR